MNGLKYEWDGTTLIFGPEGDVAQVVNGQQLTAGHWRSESAECDNCIRFDLNGLQQPPIPCKYRFNEFNQLVAALKKPDGTFTDEFTFIGFIKVDETGAMVFTLITDEGAVMARNVIVYGNLHFDSSNFLVIDLAGGGSARIRGDGGSASIEALANLSDPHAKAADLLKFHASTVNRLTSGKKKTYLANIQLKGNWDIQDNSIVFLAAHENGSMKIGFAGKFKGVAAGFAYSPDGGKVGFVISGAHTWNSGSASWDVLLGYSKAHFEGHLSGAAQQMLPNGAVALTGSMDIAGKDVSFDMNIQARFTWNQANNLIFVADVQTTPGHELNYDLKLEGTFVFDGATLRFDARVSKTNATVSFALATSGNREALIFALAMTLDRETSQVDLSFTFSLTLHWANGKLVKGQPQKTIAADAG
jgi:hypothetical protein